MGIVIIAGECGAAELFGTVFPPSGTITVTGRIRVRSADSAVIIGKNGEAHIENALGIIVSGDDPPTDIPAGIQLITCGAGAKNTVSFSSLTESGITLSLNRSMNTAAGRCDPLEFPAAGTGGADVFSYMSAFAAALLLGIIPT